MHRGDNILSKLDHPKTGSESSNWLHYIHCHGNTPFDLDLSLGSTRGKSHCLGMRLSD